MAFYYVASARQSLPRARFPPPGKLSSGLAFVWIDRYLDTVQTGPMYLRMPKVAQCVADSIFEGERLSQYELRAFVVMANHVHVLLLPKIPPSRLRNL